MASGKTAVDAHKEDFVRQYKLIFKQVLDRRPSGTRRRLANALDKNPSFVSQISNPVYPIPIPPSHIDTVFQICHFSNEEKSSFCLAYEQAHPGRLEVSTMPLGKREAVFQLPDLGDARRNVRLDNAVRQFIEQISDVFTKS